MKRVLLIFICFGLLSLGAVRVSQKPYTHLQPDGQRVDLLLSGDEFYRYLTDLKGYSVVIDPSTEAVVYAQREGEKLAPTRDWVGKTDPEALGLQPGLQPSKEEIRRIAVSNGSESPSREGHAPTIGTINNLVIFIRFLDQAEYIEPLSIYDTMFNSTTAPSMRGFFLEESSNQLTVNSTFYPAAEGGIVRSFRDGHDRAYFSPLTDSNPYGYSTNSEGQQRLRLMLWFAINSVSSSIPSSLDLDADNDGEVDNVVFVCQGMSDTWNDILWPHHNRLYPYTFAMIGTLMVADYNFQLSWEVEAGTAAHEFSHSLNFPDLYHYDNNLDPVGAWDTMNSQSNPPQHHTTYMKHKYGGWFASIPLITPTSTATQYSLTAIDQNPFACYRIASTRPNEYYVMEYRRDTGTYESGVPASGLIVYRVLSSYGGSALWGNPHGPPDEVYVYRPGINANNENGYIDAANFSLQSGRVDIYTGTDPSPWLYGDGSAELPGNLVITNIGSTGGTSISFWIRDNSPNRWLGISGNLWTQPINWSHGTVPTVDDDVVVPETNGWDPLISVPGQACKSLELRSGAELTIAAGSLEVADNLTSYGTIDLTSSDATLYVYDDLNLMSGSLTRFYNAGAEIVVEEDLRFASGATANWSLGYLEFSGSGTSSLICESPLSIANLRIEKTGGGACVIPATNTAVLTVNGAVTVQSGTLSHGYTGTTIVKGNLHAYSGSLNFYAGTVSLEGNSSSSIRIDNSGSYLHKLRIAKSGSAGVSLSTSNTVVGNDLSIVSGYLSTGANTLYVAGNWTNGVGPDAFYEGTGRVVFNGLSNQNCSSETFNILELNKSGRLLVPIGSTISCAVYDWTSGGLTVSGGSFTASDLADDGIFGSYTLSAGSIELTQDASHYVDLRSANINISGGVFSVYGGGGAMWMAYQGTTTFTMSGGYFDVRDQDIMINSAYLLNETITGGYIRTRGDLTVQRTDFNPAGGYLEFWGGTNSSVFVASGSTLWTLVVNKTSTREDQDFRLSRDGTRTTLTRANTLSASGSLLISEVLIILNGVFDVNGQTITVNNDLTVNGTLKMSSGSLTVYDTVTWNGSAQVSGGSISCAGEWTFGSSSTALLNGSQVLINNPYGGVLTNHSSLAGFGNLEINATEEDPVCHYSSPAGTPLKVAGTLLLSGSVTLNLNSFGCQAQSLSINEDCALLVGDSGSLDIQSSLTLAGRLDVGPGSVSTHGFITFPASGLLSIDWGSFINDSPWFDMRGTVYLRGGMDIDNGSFEIMNNNVYLASHPTRVFSNAMLTFGRGFTAYEAGAYQPVWGSLVLNGSSSSALYLAADNYLSYLDIQKDPAATVMLAGNALATGYVWVHSGKLDLGGYDLTVQGDLGVQGELILPPDSDILIASGQTLSVRYGGSLKALGAISQPVSVSSYGTGGYYAFEVWDGSSIAASYCAFSHMDANGVYIQNGAVIDPTVAFDHCVFQSGAPGGWLLRMDNNQTLTVNGPLFPANTWSGAGNVLKTVNSGSTTFIAYSGAFSGPTYETDPFNRINWQQGGIMPVQNLRISATEDNYTLNWDYSYPYSCFKVYSADSPDGTFSFLGTSSALNWTAQITGARRFYRVTAVQ
ncbi:MAG TPA: hypothetical protein PKX36_04545 [Candidatus Cloacimonadota bacterium]|nr:hypothetical protein [Candidatus Cloacimonadota bacterium]